MEAIGGRPVVCRMPKAPRRAGLSNREACSVSAQCGARPRPSYRRLSRYDETALGPEGDSLDDLR
jgi:hypothetical protein